jgi:hypothetical protein
LQKIWTAWQDLANTPPPGAFRDVVNGRGIAQPEQMNRMHPPERIPDQHCRPSAPARISPAGRDHGHGNNQSRAVQDLHRKIAFAAAAAKTRTTCATGATNSSATGRKVTLTDATDYTLTIDATPRHGDGLTRNELQITNTAAVRSLRPRRQPVNINAGASAAMTRRGVIDGLLTRLDTWRPTGTQSTPSTARPAAPMITRNPGIAFFTGTTAATIGSPPDSRSPNPNKDTSPDRGRQHGP